VLELPEDELVVELPDGTLAGVVGIPTLPLG